MPDLLRHTSGPSELIRSVSGDFMLSEEDSLGNTWSFCKKIITNEQGAAGLRINTNQTQNVLSDEKLKMILILS